MPLAIMSVGSPSGIASPPPPRLLLLLVNRDNTPPLKEVCSCLAPLELPLLSDHQVGPSFSTQREQSVRANHLLSKRIPLCHSKLSMARARGRRREDQDPMAPGRRWRPSKWLPSAFIGTLIVSAVFVSLAMASTCSQAVKRSVGSVSDHLMIVKRWI